MTEFYAQPYADAEGFHFQDMEKFEKGMAALEKRGVEEVEIQFIEGDSAEAQLFEALQLNQASIERWFEDIEALDEHEMAALYYIVAFYGEKNLDKALALVEDEVRAFEGSVEDYARDLAESTGEGINTFTNPEFYFDYEAFGRDLGYNGEDGSREVQEELDEAQRELEEAATGEADADEIEELEDRVEDLEKQMKELDARTNEEIGEEYVDGIGGVKELGMETAEMYFDWEKLARDMELGGDVTQFDFAGSSWVVDYHG
jgi:antirestriction protein